MHSDDRRDRNYPGEPTDEQMREREREREREKRALEEEAEREAEAHEPDETTGEVLGISGGPPPEEREPVPSGTPGDRTRAGRTGTDQPGAGARDVTGSRGSTGTVTGGHGATPQRSGATGTDIGEN